VEAPVQVGSSAVLKPPWACGLRWHSLTGEPEGVPKPQENPLVQEPPLQQKVGG
jgi:hypothetical protein